MKQNIIVRSNQFNPLTSRLRISNFFTVKWTKCIFKFYKYDFNMTFSFGIVEIQKTNLRIIAKIRVHSSYERVRNWFLRIVRNRKCVRVFFFHTIFFPCKLNIHRSMFSRSDRSAVEPVCENRILTLIRAFNNFFTHYDTSAKGLT